MWPFRARKRKARQLALDKACRLLTNQIQGSAAIDQFFEKSHNLWALGYCFGMLQASLEVADPEAKLSDSEYRSHIGAGLGLVYANEAFGVVQYHVGLSSMDNDQFHAGRIAGATEYVQVLNAKGDQAHELLRYLKTAKLERSSIVL